MLGVRPVRCILLPIAVLGRMIMAESASRPNQKPDPPVGEPRLESWGEIASYLRRDIRTVQRWEKYLNLPVRRLQIGKLGSVYAYRSELDKWYQERQPQVT